ncbi:MAG: glycosyltransferase family 39 protein [Deltaproteobacteria bacterium]|nr:glycosyltransferase family 39 protein [Deltaproteobacteria bacterium]
MVGVLQRHAALSLFVIGALFLAPRIWCETSITGQDEYWLSFRTPMETLDHDNWLTPWVNGEPRLKKPPLLYWAMLSSYSLLGINLFAARIWGVLAGAGLALCAALLYRELFKKSGILAGLITLGTISVAIEGRRAMLDLPLAFFTASAVYLAIRWGKSGKPGWLLSAAGALGLSFLIKGPVGIILFTVAAMVALFVYNKWRFLFSHLSHILWAAVVVGGVALPWPVIMAVLWPRFLEVLNSEVGARGLGGFHLGDALSTLGESFGLVFPWSLILLAALLTALWRWKSTENRHSLFLAGWFFGCVVPFMFIHSFARYMTPLVPAGCVLCARWLETPTTTMKWKHTLLCISMGLMALISVAFALFFIWFDRGTPMGILTLAAVGGLLWVTFSKTTPHWTAGAVAVLFTCIIGGLYPTLGINALPPNLDDVIGMRQVASFNSAQPSMLSMHLKRSALRLRAGVEKDQQILKRLDGFVFVRESDIDQFEALARNLGIHFEKAGQFKTFYSRQAWIRFAREDATADDWKEAFQKRSLDDLKPTICYYRVYPSPITPGKPPSADIDP